MQKLKEGNSDISTLKNLWLNFKIKWLIYG